MTDAPRSDAPADGRTPWYRRRLALAAAALVVVAAVVATALVLGGRPGSQEVGEREAAATTAPASTAPPSTAPPPPLVPPADPNAQPVVADQLPPALPAAALDDPVDLEGVTVDVPTIEAIEAEAQGKGSIAGPAVRVTVRLRNGTAAPLALDDAVVTLTFGADSAPASPVEDSSVARFSGTLEPGDAGEGVYVFRVPADQRGAVTVQVAVRPGASVVTFAGAVD
jgi:hypothetical protein